jgi:hypothetical protein
MPPCKPKRVSREFVFPSRTKGFELDGKNIQFASGLDLVERHGKMHALILRTVNQQLYL